MGFKNVTEIDQFTEENHYVIMICFYPHHFPHLSAPQD